MKKIFLLLALFSIGAIAFSQGISVRFIGRINDTNYCRLDSVAVTNITRNWTETVVYPDTIIVLGTVGTNLNIATSQGLGQNIPNPFDCETRAELSVSQRENVRMQLLDISGKVYAEYNNSLDAGVHSFDISAAAPQTYILNATIGNRSYSIRMVNTGSGCGSSIKYAGISGSIISKQTWDNESQIGDNMRYIGYTNIGGNILESEPVLQPLRENQDVVLAFRSGSTGTLNGHGYVDLGLPSETLWATCNVGANAPEEYGDYFAWGETTPKTSYNWSTYRYCINGRYDNLTKYCHISTYGYNGYTDNLTTLEASDDAATANWGPNWRMPIEDDWDELFINCISTMTTQNGVEGFLLTGPTGNSIFLPKAGMHHDGGFDYVGSYGFYWSSSLLTGYYTSNPSAARCLALLDYSASDSDSRSIGFSVRAVAGSVPHHPAVTTSEVYNITTTGATLNGNVTSAGGTTVTSRGFLYGTNSSNLTQTVQSGSGTGSFSANITGLTSGTTYYYKAYATNSTGTAYGEVRSFATENPANGTFNGHDFVDLGLPSGTLWATCNIGANSPEDYGNLFAWGETAPKSTYTWSTYIYSYGSAENFQSLIKYCSNSQYGANGFCDNLTSLDASDDAAIVNWGGGWRMPTMDDLNELINNCTIIATTQNGICGVIIKGPNGNSIFVPKGGCWSSSLYTEAPCGAWALRVTYYGTDGDWNYDGTYVGGWNYRCYGYSVRPVCNSIGGDASIFVPTVTTSTASSITATGATLSGNVTSDGGATVTARGFLYGTNASNLTQTVQSGSGTGSFTTSLSGLTSGTTYYYKTYAINSAGTAYGEVMSFTTELSVPTVITGTASNITATSTTLSGNVTYDGGVIVTARGFLYGTNASNLTQTIQSGSGTGSFTSALTGLTLGTTYYYKAYATNSAGTAYGEVRSFTTAFTTESTSYSEPSGYVNGYGYVDLGLPSGTLWATMNVGASTPEGYGDYYAWGETEPKETYNWSTYRYCNGSGSTLTKYCSNSMFGNNGFSDNITSLEASDDAANANWGSGWRMPTYDEMVELKNNCTVTWSTQNGVNGRLFTGSNGNSIFLPAAGNRSDSNLYNAGSRGFYWSSLLYTGGPYAVWSLDFWSDGYGMNYSDERRLGLSVRAVCNGDNIGGDASISVPTVTTVIASSITTTGATLSGNVTSDGGTTVSARGFLYGTNASNLTQTVQSGSGTGSFTKALTGLTSGTTYYYKAYATNSVGTAYGEVMSFTTESSTVSVPTVTTSSASNISTTGVTLSGNVTSDGGATVTARGFLYGTNASNLTQTVQSGSGTGSFTKSLTGLTSGTTYYYKAYATNSAGTAYGEVRSFTTENLGITTGTLNGYDWVDLGLPSGTRWATCNVGATNPEDYGNYYAWGEITTKETYNWSTYRYCNGTNSTLTKYCTNSRYGDNGFTDNLTTLEAYDDVATANWGSAWRMPTREEFNELKNNCTVTWTTQNGVNGRLFSAPNGNYIFLPAAGSRFHYDLSNDGSKGGYWSSSLVTDQPFRASLFSFYSGNYSMASDYRYGGLSVRPVCNDNNIGGDANISVPTVTTGTASSIAATGVTLSGDVASDGGATVTARGFLYGTNASNLTQTVQSGSGTGSFTKSLTGLTSGTTYYYKAYATNSAGTAYGEVRSFTTENTGATTGTLNGHDWVDLGLPSGTRWATCNVGATNPEDYGNYYAWGETTTKTTYDWSTYRYCNGSYNTLTKYCNSSSDGDNGFTDNLTTLEASDDAATTNWGSGWRMPTYNELNELQNNCTVSWTTQNGVNGRLFTGSNGNSIFLPAAGFTYDSEPDGRSNGYYWSSSLWTGYPYNALYLYFYSGNYSMNGTNRSYGHSVRPVCNQ